ncbi:hypothetical protein ATX86_11020 [Oenococcus oeni]|nr:hypothetical protein ATX86_11020 [Oenococcus oeni]
MSRQILLKDRIIQAAVAIIEAGGTPTFSTISRRLGSRSQALYPYINLHLGRGHYLSLTGT